MTFGENPDHSVVDRGRARPHRLRLAVRPREPLPLPDRQVHAERGRRLPGDVDHDRRRDRLALQLQPDRPQRRHRSRRGRGHPDPHLVPGPRRRASRSTASSSTGCCRWPAWPTASPPADGQFDGNNSKDVYARLDYKIGGMGLDGDMGGKEAPDKNWRDNSLRLGVFVYRGDASDINFPLDRRGGQHDQHPGRPLPAHRLLRERLLARPQRLRGVRARHGHAAASSTAPRGDLLTRDRADLRLLVHPGRLRLLSLAARRRPLRDRDARRPQRPEPAHRRLQRERAHPRQRQGDARVPARPARGEEPLAERRSCASPSRPNGARSRAPRRDLS